MHPLHLAVPPRMGPIEPPGDVLAALRAATHDAHLRLETDLALTDAGLGLARYRAVLARFFGFWRSWEDVVAAMLPEPGFLAPRRRGALVERDLRALGLGE